MNMKLPGSNPHQFLFGPMVRHQLPEQRGERKGVLIGVLAIFFLSPALLSAADCSVPAIHCDKNANALATATLLHDRGYYRQAYTTAQCAFDQTADPSQQIAALHLAGRSAVRFGDTVGAQKVLQRALDLSMATGDRSLQGRSLYYLGIYHERRKQHEQALKRFHDALAVFDPQRDRQAIADILFEIGDIEIAHSEFERGIQSYEKAVTHPHNTPGETAKALDYLGYAHRRLGDYAKAIGYHRQALRVAEGMPAGSERTGAEARARNHIGLCLREQAMADAPERAQMAIELLQQALQEEHVGLDAINRSDLDLRRQGYIQRAVARIHLDLADLRPAERKGHLEQALASATAALETGGRMCDDEWRGLALHTLAELHARLDRHDEAEARLHEAIAIWQKLGDRNGLGQAWRQMAINVELPRSNIGQARERLRRALQAFESIQARDEMVGVNVALGGLHERDGKPVEARAAYESAIRLLENTRTHAGTDENKIVYFSRRRQAYEALISLLVREFRHRGSMRDGEEAFRISELARGRVMRDLIAQSSAALTARVEPAMLREERRLLEEVERLRGQLAIPAQGDVALARRRAQLYQAEKRLARHYEHLAQRYPDYIRLKRPAATTLQAVRARIRPGIVLLEYFIGEKQSFLFVVNHAGLAAILELPLMRRDLARDVDRLRLPFREIKHMDSRQAGAYLRSSGSFDLALAEQLYRQLFAPVEPYMGNASGVLLVPDGPLFHLPFEALVRHRHSTLFSGFPDEVGRSVFLLDRAPPITYAISASLLAGAHSATLAPRMAAFVNPALKSAPAEIGILEAMRDPVPKVFKGNDATKERFVKEAARFNSLYIATHGELNEAYPMHSGIWFSEAGRERGALVSATDIFSMSLPARLFVLRACETGVGRIHNGEGVMGLARALKYAGVGDLVLTSWSVDDGPSSDLIARFYADMPQNGGPLALHRAKRQLRQSETSYLAHPFFWAPFTYWQ